MVALGRGVLEGEFDRETGLRDILGPDIVDGKGVGGRLDLGDVHFAQLLNMMQHIAKLLGKFGFFLRGERQSRQIGDMVDVEFDG